MKQSLYQKANLLGVIIFFVLIIVALNSCRKDYFPGTIPVDLSTPISFSKDVLPIFTTECAKSGCHVTGAQVPDLTTANAYDNLLGLGYVDTTTNDVTKSKLYQMLTSASKPMPPSGKLSSDMIGKIQAWILQKAPNN